MKDFSQSYYTDDEDDEGGPGSPPSASSSALSSTTSLPFCNKLQSRSGTSSGVEWIPMGSLSRRAQDDFTSLLPRSGQGRRKKPNVVGIRNVRDLAKKLPNGAMVKVRLIALCAGFRIIR